MTEDILVEFLSVDFNFIRYDCDHFLFVLIEKIYDLFFQFKLT
jgi:hypothetical protein